MRRRCARKRRESRAPAERGKNARRQCPFRPGKPRLRHVVNRPCHVLTPGAAPILNSARIAVHRLGSLLPAWPGQLPAPPIHSAEDVECLLTGMPTGPDDQIWIGLTNNEPYSSDSKAYVWTDYSSADYFNWNENEPSDNDVEKCGRIYGSGMGSC